MIDKPVVSTIINFLNEGKYLAEAIESVLAQSYSDWELLLVDDGSDDISSQIARGYADLYSGQIRYLEHTDHVNRGASAARNVGISNAKGRYLAFLDGDDVWLSHKLEEQVAILQSQPQAAMLYGATQWWYSWTGQPEDLERDYVPDLGVRLNTLIRPPTLLTLFLQTKAMVPCLCSVLIRREIAEGIGGFEERFRRLYTDQAFYAKVCARASVFVADECWDKYRQHPDSCVSVGDESGERDRARVYYLKWLNKYLSSQGINDSDLWRALKSKTRRYGRPTVYRALKNRWRRAVQSTRFIGAIGRTAIPSRLQRWFDPDGGRGKQS